MIKRITKTDGKESTLLIFGSGDIKISCGLDGEDKTTPMVAMWQGLPKSIGEISFEGASIDSEGSLRLSSDSIELIFAKAESIDVLIEALEDCKKLFEIPKEERLRKLHSISK